MFHTILSRRHPAVPVEFVPGFRTSVHGSHCPKSNGCIPALSSCPCFGFSLLSSARLRHGQQRSLVVSSLNDKGFGKKNVGVKRKLSESEKPVLRNSGQEEVGSKSETGTIDEDDIIPQVVKDRMMKRISVTMGVPISSGFACFPLFGYLKGKVDFPQWLPALSASTLICMAGLGIVYGIVSASWDPSIEGSLLGWKEAQLNWPIIFEKADDEQEKK